MVSGRPPRRIQRKRTKGWRMPEGAVNCCRPGEYGNPFRVGDSVEFWPGDTGLAFDIIVTITPELAVALFAAHTIESGWLEQLKRELRGKDLVCWCALGAPCHADWMLKQANPPMTIHIDSTAPEAALFRPGFDAALAHAAEQMRRGRRRA